jgi:predicted HD phosphohydrolase
VTRAELVELLTRMGDTPSDDADGLSALDHGLQCAFELARSRPEDVELQVAGLVHDVGHAFGPADEHGRLGAACARDALGDRVATLVEAHVVAKRYLVTTDATYRSRLSESSVLTLALQGGALTPRDAAVFASSSHAADAVELRRADDAAKVPGRVVPPLEAWVPTLLGLDTMTGPET